MARKTDKQSDQSTYSRRPRSNFRNRENSSYSGFGFDKPGIPPFKAPVPSAQQAKAFDLPLARTQEEQDQLRMLRLLTETELPMEEFQELAELSLVKARDLLNRIDNAEELVNLEDLRIELDPPNADLLESLINKRIIDNAAADCLLRIAHHSPITKAYDEGNFDINKFDQLADNVLGNIIDEDKIDQAFPNLGIKLILTIIIMAHEIIVKSILGGLCKFIKSTLGNIPLVGAILVFPLEKLLDLTGAQLLLDKKFKACGTKKRSLRQELQDFVDLQPDKLNPDYEDPLNTAGSTPANQNRCDPNYVPTETDKQVARRILDIAVRIENGAENHTVKRPKLGDTVTNVGVNKPTLTRLLLLRTGKSEVNQIVMTANAVKMKSAPSPGVAVADKASAELLGFFANLNALSQRFDAKVTGIINLDFLNKNFKEWLCCFVRLVYLVIPRYDAGNKPATNPDGTPILNANGGPTFKPSNQRTKAEKFFKTGALGVQGDTDPEVDKQKKEELDRFRQGNVNLEDLDGNKGFDQAKKWVAYLDAVLGLLTGTISVNMNINLNIFKADFFQGVLKLAIAETGSLLMTALHRQLEKNVFKIIDEMTKTLPDVKLAMELCKPFSWLMGTLKISTEQFFGKFQEILAQMWLDGKAVTDDIESSLTITTSNKSIDLFRRILQILLNWDTALVNFCALNTATTEAEKQQITERIVGQTIKKAVEGTIFDFDKNNAKANRARNIMAKLSPVYTPNVNLSPDGSDPYETDLNANPLTDNRRDFHLKMLGRDPELLRDVNLLGPVEKPDLSSTRPSDPMGVLRSMVKGCGDEFKSIIRDRETDIVAIHKALLK